MSQDALEIDFDASKWAYKAEGACNVVVEYVGKNKLCLGQVLRIPKRETPQDLNSKFAAFWREVSPEWRSREAYTSEAIHKILSPKYTLSPTLVTLPQEFVDNLSNEIQQHRPSARERIVALLPVGSLMQDFTRLLLCDPIPPNNIAEYCVEIKPKWSTLPIYQGQIAPACRYCMHQALKFSIPSQRSSFCPLDLFSSNRIRMQKAIRCLVENPQNNLKIFVNGCLIYGDGKLETATTTHPVFLRSLFPQVRFDILL